MAKLLTHRNLSLFIFIFINITFCIRYAIRISPSFAIISTIAYLIITSFVLLYSSKKQSSLNWLIAIGSVWLIGCAVILYHIPLDTIRVDRVEMIELFWDAVSDGEYPYNPRGTYNGNHPGPMPFYFILCYPFYLMELYAIIPILSLVIWVCYYYRNNRDNTTLLFLLLITSPACYWEILCRSTIIFNTLIFLFWFVCLKNFQDYSAKNLFISAILGGLIMSTRSIFAIPIIAFCVYAFFNISKVKTIQWGLILFGTFVLTHLPLFYYGIDNVMNLNPIWLQSNFFIPTEYMIICILLLIAVAVRCHSFEKIVFISGMFLFGITLLYIIRYIAIAGIEHSITKGCDLSYFLFSVPFLFLSLKNKPIDAKQ